MKEQKLNNQRMFEFLSGFDYITEKYKITKDDELYTEFSEYESKSRIADVVKHDYSALYDNIKLVYGDDKKAIEMMAVYKSVKEKIVNQFLNLPGLERLYDEHFFEFEWDMHSRLDFDNHNISFYRDHFIHQVRNLYEMYIFFEDETFMENFRTLFISDNCKVSGYVKQELKIAVENFIKEHSIDIGTDLFFKYYNKYKEIILGNVRDKDDNASYIVFLEQCLGDYIIKASAAMCALFHDIGYPILHFLNMKNRISTFMPSLHMFIGDGGNGFEQIYSLLCNSLLVKIVPKKELFTQVCSGKNHGAVSAIAFLLAFYENGAINSIRTEKRIAIELAALAIYEHTIKYNCIEPEHFEYYRPIYSSNPLSYHLRICDDMQEWHRTYFEIHDIADIMFCNKCGTPYMRSKHDSKSGKKQYEYLCRCKRAVPVRQNDFIRRKIIDIINCEEVVVKFDDGCKTLSFEFDYNQFLLLKMCIMAPTFSKYRIKELNKLKEILSFQRYGGYDKTVVNFRLSPNPFVLKAAIIDDVLKLDKKLLNTRGCAKVCKLFADVFQDNIQKVKSYVEEFKDKLSSAVKAYASSPGQLEFYLGTLIDKIFTLTNVETVQPAAIDCVRKTKMFKDDLLIKSIAENFLFYHTLQLISVFLAKVNSVQYDLWHSSIEKGKLKTTVLEEFEGMLFDELVGKVHNKIEQDADSVNALVNDAIVQYSKYFENDDTKLCHDEYYEHCKTDSGLYDIVSKYCEKDNPINSIQVYTLDYYSDLELYMELQNSLDKIKNLEHFKM